MRRRAAVAHVVGARALRRRLRLCRRRASTRSASTPTAAAAPSDLSVAVGPVSVPAAVDRPQIVVTMGPNQVRLDEFNRWDAPLQNNIARVVAENLVALLGTPRVTLSPQTLSADADYRVAIEVQRFDSALGEAATLDAVWTVSRTKDGTVADGPHHRARADRRRKATTRSPPPTAARWRA